MLGPSILTCTWYRSHLVILLVFVRVFSPDQFQAGINISHTLVKLASWVFLVVDKFGFEVRVGIERILYCAGARVQGNQAIAFAGLGATIVPLDIIT